MYKKIILISIILAFTFASATGGTQDYSGGIIFESSVGFTGLREEGSTGLSELRDDLDYLGFTATDSLELKARYEEITPRLLKKSEILVLINPIRSLSYEELDRVEKYVSEGGKLLVINDNPSTRENANELARGFRVEFLGRYIGSAKMIVNNSGGKLHSAMPMQHYGDREPEIAFTVNTTAREWKSFWEIGEETPSERYLILLGIKHGKGRVAFLSDKDFLLNQNYNSSFSLFKSIISWLETGESLSPEEPELAFLEKSISVSTYHGAAASFSLNLSNPSPTNETVSISIPGELRPVLSFENYSFELTALSEDEIPGAVRCPGNISRLRESLNITVSAGGINRTYSLPLELTCKKPEISISRDKISATSYYETNYLLRLFISNPTPVREKVEIEFQQPLATVLSLESVTFELSPSSSKGILATINCSGDIFYIQDYMNITTRAGDYSSSQLLPVEVKCVARE